MNFDKISLFSLFFSLTCMNLPHLPMWNDGLLGFRFLNFSLSCSPSFLDLYVVGASRGALFEWFFHTLSVPEPTLVVFNERMKWLPWAMDRPWGRRWDWLLLVCPCHSQFCFMGRDCTTRMRMQNAPYHHLYDFAECLVLNLPHSERNSINYMYHSFHYLVVFSTILSLLFYFCLLRSRYRLILLIVFYHSY